ncbi:PLP-dependent aminotransferase family protein [Tropicimonas sp. IMCC34043]|uniref:aminotransferase-like domain-containing protein n=1 Tax=Tropicimonas sp. IMCC34043 TaxID=2248760 RepID=UPI000E236183|nr:PLP-dependent aminotransferase family protein [Tropicimonas sp. IMCC34043]
MEDLQLEGGTKYKVLADRLEAAIEDGTLTVGDRLPPVRELAWQIGITPGTVARAYALLTDAGRLEAVVGRGTFVAARRRPVVDDVWQRPVPPEETGSVNLYSPRLPDMGQVAAIRRAFEAVARGPECDLTEYPTRDGFRPAREAVVTWLSDVMLGRVDEQDVVLAHGGQNAISLVLQAAVRAPRPVILVEDLSYAGFRRAAEMLRIEVAGVPSDADGIIPEELERIARRTGASLLCTSPEVHNPTGCHTPMPRRQALAAICKDAGVQILEDDCYRIGPARAPSYRALWPEGGWYVSSISKTITPALRIGFAIAAEGHTGALRRAAEYGFFGLARPLAEVARIVMSDPETKATVVRVSARLQEYIQAAVNILGRYDLRWNADVPFLWLALPLGWRASDFTLAAERVGVQLRSAEEFALREGRAPHAVRIAVNGRIPLARFEEAMGRLRDLLDDPPCRMSV